jgi:hypothetical protein
MFPRSSTRLLSRTFRLGILASRRAAQQLLEIEGTRILDRTLETSRNLRIVEPMLLTEISLDFLPDDLSCARELTRHRRFVLAEQTSGLRERQLFPIVAAKPETIAIRQPGQAPQQRQADQRQESQSVGIGNDRTGVKRRSGLISLDRRQTPVGSNAIDLPLRENGTQPRGQTAASVKVAKERPPLAVALLKAEEVRVDRVRLLACAAARIEGVGCPIKDGTILKHEMVPGQLVAIRARRSQRKVLEMQPRPVAFEPLDVWRPSGKCLLGAPLERRRERSLGHMPSRGVGLLVQARH